MDLTKSGGGVITYIRSSSLASSPESCHSDSSSSSDQSCSPPHHSSSGHQQVSSHSRSRHSGGGKTRSPSMAKGSITKINGLVLLCKVCGDVASGFHYGVHACEGCKGFFRRSIQQNIQYRKCLKNQSCPIMRISRNRCQQCRFRKCLLVGMSRDAVRFGRIPKREKQRMLLEMQEAMSSTRSRSDTASEDSSSSPRSSSASDSCSSTDSGAEELSTPQPHWRTHHHPSSPPEDCPLTTTRGETPPRAQQNHRSSRAFPARPGNKTSHLVCPMNTSPHVHPQRSGHSVWDEFSTSFTPAVREVVEFAKRIPGFRDLSRHDQVSLLKAGTFEVLVVRFMSLFDVKERTVTFLKGRSYSVEALRSMGSGDLLNSMFDFSEKLQALDLSEEETSLFTAVVLVSADRSGLENVASVEALQETLIRALRSLIAKNHPNEMAIFTRLLLKLPDLRSLNNMHSERLLAFNVQA